MVNHARTVLLNEPARVLAGLSTIYVPQDFKPVEIPDVFAALYGFIFPDTFSLAAKIVRVDQIMQLLSSGELVPFVLSMDSRVTYGSEPAATLTAIITGSASDGSLVAILELVDHAPAVASISSALFSLPRQQITMDSLRLLWSPQQEGTIRFGALMLALIYQLDALRS